MTVFTVLKWMHTLLLWGVEFYNCLLGLVWVCTYASFLFPFHKSCSDVPSIIGGKVLKPSINVGELSSSHWIVLISTSAFWGFFIVVTTWQINPLAAPCLYKMPRLYKLFYFQTVSTLILKSIMSDSVTDTTACLSLLFAWYTFLSSFTFNWFISLDMKFSI